MRIATPAARAMDDVYRYQRHIYDATRAFYLLGRDVAIEQLAVPHDGHVLEIACGTGRNLIRIADRYPTARLYGADISEAMLATARRSVARRGLQDRVRLAAADATRFDPGATFGTPAFDRVLISYALSMIPDWHPAVHCALDALTKGGSLHIVDFGDFAGYSDWVRRAQLAWLKRFSVAPIADLAVALAKIAGSRCCDLRLETRYGGYSIVAKLTPL